MLDAHETAEISEHAHIDASTRGTRIRVGRHSVIDSFVRIKCAGGLEDVLIGDYSYINSGTVIYSGNGVRIGNNVLIAANCTLAPVNHEYRSRSTIIREQGFRASRGGILVEDDVWIGAGCVLLDGTIIRRGAVVGAHSLVRGELAAYGVYRGNPTQHCGDRS